MLKIERLALAIAEREGWLPATAQPLYAGSRSWRYHNPGNLRKSPFAVATNEGYCVFKTDQDGMAGLIWDIRQKALGNTSTGLTGSSSLKEFIYKWAPKEDGNNPDKYLSDICLWTGFAPKTTLFEIANG